MLSKKSPSSSNPTPVGLAALIKDFDLQVPLPAVQSRIVSGARRTVVNVGITIEYYPPRYAPEGAIGNLQFALRYEPIDLRVYYSLFQILDKQIIEHWVREEPTGIYARKAWYLYELLTSSTLDLPDVSSVAYIDLLNPKLHITATGHKVRRQAIKDNLLGNQIYSPIIRRTEALKNAMSQGLDKEAKALIESCDPSILTRAVNYLYTKETKSSFAIEGEAPGRDRTARFVAALSNAADFDTSDPEAFIKLQNAIVDPRYAATGWRTIQNFVGERMSDYSEQVHFICPKPNDVPALMEGWMKMVDRLHGSDVDPVSAAAAAAFGFVFVHPFEDGNGRIHRFLVHHMLAHAGFTPDKLLFPISAVMLRDRKEYDQVLERFSAPILPLTDYSLDRDGSMTVENETAYLYRFWDATPFAEYLYKCVAETIRKDLTQEIGFLPMFDAAVRATMEIVDMPDRRASFLVTLILQNNGTLSNAKRSKFDELTDDEIRKIESAIRVITDGAGEPSQPASDGSQRPVARVNQRRD